MSCNCNSKKQRPKYLDLDVIYTGDLTECNGFTIRPKSNLRTILDVLLKGSDLKADKSYVDSRMWSGTQAEYDALPTKDPNVLYLII